MLSLTKLSDKNLNHLCRKEADVRLHFHIGYVTEQ